MLNLVLVGYGSQSRVCENIECIQQQLRLFLKEQNAHVYNLERLGRAECNPELLKSKGCLQFSTRKGYADTCYWGMFPIEDYAELYTRWFVTDPNPPQRTRPRYIPYNKANLETIIQNMVGEKYAPLSDPPRCDFSIHYRFGGRDADKYYYIIEWTTQESSLTDDEMLSQFNAWIALLDEQFPDTFVSAYITNHYYDSPTAHTALYNDFDLDRLDLYALGVEYSMYIGNALPLRYEECLKKAAEYFEPCDRENGTQYIYRGDPSDFNTAVQNELHKKLSDMLIPGWFHWSWYYFCQQQESFRQRPKLLSVYRNKYCYSEPFVVVSFGMDNDCLDELIKPSGGEKLWERYSFE